jgi:hypothetical protein
VAELRVERRGDAAERAVAPRARVGDMVGGEEGTRLEVGLGFEEAVAMSCQCVMVVKNRKWMATMTSASHGSL